MCTPTLFSPSSSFRLRNATLLALLSVASVLMLTSCDSNGTDANEAPEARFTYAPENPEAKDTVEFTAEAEDLDGEVVRYRWEFDGDGQEEASGATAEYAFGAAGTYEVSLTVFDDTGASVAITNSVTVAEIGAPTARFTYTPEKPVVDESVAFTAEAEDPDGEVVGYSWDFDGDGAEDATGATTEYAFDAAGDYEVALTVTDDEDASAEASQTVTVGSAPQNVVVGNGGVFGAGNGSLTFYDSGTGEARTTGSVGGFVTGLTLSGDDRLYAPINTDFSSGGLSVTGLEALRDGSAGETLIMTGGGRRIGALRDIAFTTGDRAYATSFSGGGQVVGFSVEGGNVSAIGDTAATPVSFPEGAVAAAGKVFAANYGSGGSGTSLTVFEPGNAEDARNVTVPCDGPRSLFTDEQDELIVVCAGRTVFGEPDAPANSNARVLFLNPETEAVVDEIALDVQVGSANGSQASSYSPVGQVVHAISSGSGQVLRIDTEENTLGGPALDVPDTEGYVGLAAVTYDAVEERLYLARLALGDEGGADFEARGRVFILNDEGTVTGGFQAGVAPTTLTLVQ